METNNRTEIESIRTFAEQHGELAFAHLCTAALAGEEWAVERIANAFAAIHTHSDGRGYTDTVKLGTIRDTDTTRPDGAIARALVEA